MGKYSLEQIEKNQQNPGMGLSFQDAPSLAVLDDAFSQEGNFTANDNDETPFFLATALAHMRDGERPCRVVLS